MFQVPSAISSVKTLVDGGIKLDIHTRELNPEEMTELFKLKGKEGWLLFKEEVIEQEDINDLPKIELKKGKKSRSQETRSLLYLLWEKSDHSKTSEEFYNYHMDKINDYLREKL